RQVRQPVRHGIDVRADPDVDVARDPADVAGAACRGTLRTVADDRRLGSPWSFVLGPSSIVLSPSKVLGPRRADQGLRTKAGPWTKNGPSTKNKGPSTSCLWRK